MRVLFMGSGELACPALHALLTSGKDEVIAVITQPDRPKGRNLKMQPCPVKAAFSGKAPVLTPVKVGAPEILDQISSFQPDVIVVVAYGQLLKPALLSIPRSGCINLHPSLLPKYRGAAPIQWAIANGESVTGVTTMYLNERMDAGDIILQRESPIGDSDTGGTLHDRLASEGALLLIETLDLIRGGVAPRTAQAEAAATYAPKLSKGDGRIDWTWPAARIGDRVRAFNPWPVCWCVTPGDAAGRLRVWGARVEDGEGSPGQIIDLMHGPLVVTGDRAVRLLDIQPEGRKRLSGEAFARGYSLALGQSLG